MRLSCVAVLCAFVLSVCVYASKCEKNVYYVAQNGSDSWSGKLPEPNKDKTDGPFATIQKAQQTARKAQSDASIKPSVVNIRSGVYHLPQPLTFPSQQKGSLVFKAHKNEKVTLSGARPVAKWKKHKKRIYKADLSNIKLAEKPFMQIFYKGDAQPLARVPNVDESNPCIGGFAFVAEDNDPNTAIFSYDPQVLDPAKWKHPEKAIVDMIFWPGYGNWRVPVTGVDLKKHQIALDKEKMIIKRNDRFYVLNVFEELDAPGEWYFDDETKILYFWPPDGKKPKCGEVWIPVLDSVVQFTGTQNNPVHDIHLQRLTLGYCLHNGVKMQAAQNCSLTGCTIRGTGWNGISVEVDSLNNRIVSCDIFQTGYCGIRMGGLIKENERISGNLIDNNHIYHVGLIQNMEGAGIYAISAGNNTFSHNHVHDTPRWGIGFNAAGDNVIEYNYIHNVNTKTEDAGAINTVSSWGGWTPSFDPNTNDFVCGNKIRYNKIHDSGGCGTVHWWTTLHDLPKDEPAHPYFSFGIYLDLASSGTHVYGNIVYDTFNGGVIVGGGEDNLIENNIFVNGKICQIYAVDWRPRFPMRRNRVERNIIVYDEPKALYFNQTLQGGGKWTPEMITLNNNIIHTPNEKKIMMHEEDEIFDFAWWQSQGMDTNSILADPRFVDEANHDYRLRPESPAFKMGFKPIPVDKIGLYNDPPYRTIGSCD